MSVTEARIKPRPLAARRDHWSGLYGLEHKFMKPVRCPTCDLVWNIRDDAPRGITCPRCLAALNNPYASAESAPSVESAPSIGVKPPPMPVLPLEHQVKRDARVGAVGIVVVLLIVVFGV